MPRFSFYEEALLIHAQLSRATWAILDAWDTAPGDSVALLQALDDLRTAQQQTLVRCACTPTRPSGDWCTGHCAHTTQGADDAHRS